MWVVVVGDGAAEGPPHECDYPYGCPCMVIGRKSRRREEGNCGEWVWFWAAFRPEPLAVNTPPAQRKVVEIME